MQNKKYYKNKCLYQGQIAEEEFKRVAIERFNLLVIKASKEEQRIDKFDFICKNKKTKISYKVEVKSEKRNRRNDENIEEKWLWIEFKGILGYEGWLYGKADYIAFEKGEEFWLIKRKTLVNIAENLIDISEKAIKSKSSKYKGYKRRQRPHELIGQIKYSDIENYCKKWKKKQR